MDIWKLVKELESNAKDNVVELAQAKATMLVNYGPNGKSIPGLINQDQTLLQMLLAVLEPLTCAKIKLRELAEIVDAYLDGGLGPVDAMKQVIKLKATKEG